MVKRLLLLLTAAGAATPLPAACFVNPLGVIDRLVCITINTGTVTGATDTQVLYGSSSGTLTSSANLTYDNTLVKFIVGTRLILDAGSNKSTLTVKAGSAQSTTVLQRWSDASDVSLALIDSTGAHANYSSGTQKWWFGGTGLLAASDRCIQWKDNIDSAAGTVDTQICRVASTGGIKIQDGGSSLGAFEAASFTSGTAGSPGRVTLEQGSAPSSPAANNHAFYVDGAGDFYQKNSAGTTRRFLYALASASSVLKGDGSAVSGTSTNCVLVDGTSAACGTGGGVGEWSSSLNLGTVLDLSCAEGTFTATGLTTGTVVLTVPYAGIGAVSSQGWASAADTAKVRVCNTSGADVAVSGTFTVKAARGYLSGSGTIDFASIPAGSTSTATVTVTGATTSMGAIPMPPAAFNAGILLTARVTAADTVTLYAANLTEADIDPASGSFTGMVIQ